MPENVVICHYRPRAGRGRRAARADPRASPRLPGRGAGDRHAGVRLRRPRAARPRSARRRDLRVDRRRGVGAACEPAPEDLADLGAHGSPLRIAGGAARRVPRPTPRIAALHADSWRRSYRGIYTDAYLDDEAPAERLRARGPSASPTHAPTSARWSRCRTESSSDSSTPCSTTIRSGVPCSTTSTSAPTGSAIGSGAGSWPLLHARSSTSVRAAACTSGCSSANAHARAFYAARGGAEVERADRRPPPTAPPIVVLRVAWPDPERRQFALCTPESPHRRAARLHRRASAAAAAKQSCDAVTH